MYALQEINIGSAIKTANSVKFVPMYHCTRCGRTIVCYHTRLSYTQMRTRLSRMDKLISIKHACRKFGEDDLDAAPCELIGYKKIMEEALNENHAH